MGAQWPTSHSPSTTGFSRTARADALPLGACSHVPLKNVAKYRRAHVRPRYTAARSCSA